LVARDAEHAIVFKRLSPHEVAFLSACQEHKTCTAAMDTVANMAQNDVEIETFQQDFAALIAAEVLIQLK